VEVVEASRMNPLPAVADEAGAAAAPKAATMAAAIEMKRNVPGMCPLRTVLYQ
jgi:hypothetical protein